MRSDIWPDPNKWAASACPARSPVPVWLSCLQSLWSACPRHGLPGEFSLPFWVMDPVSLRTEVTDLFGTTERLHGRQFFSGVGGMVSGWLKLTAFIVHLISNLMLPLIWNEALGCAWEIGDSWFRAYLPLVREGLCDFWVMQLRAPGAQPLLSGQWTELWSGDHMLGTNQRRHFSPILFHW